MENKPLIILGAGASHDLVPTLTVASSLPVFPLTDQLVNAGNLDHGLSLRYFQVKSLFSQIAPMMMKDEKGNQKFSFEDSLKFIKDTDQLVALRFYLSDLFYKLSNNQELKKHTVNNYLALINYILGSECSGAYVVSFNYDTQFEIQLSSFTDLFPNALIRMNNYIDGPIKLLKVHGSSDWFNVQLKEDVRGYISMGSAVDSFNFLKNNPQFKTPDIYTRQDLENSDPTEKYLKIPVIIPPVTGDKTFVCPPRHTEILTEALPAIKNVLVVGWRAGDENLLQLMKQRMVDSPEFTIVSKTEKGARAVAAKIAEYFPRMIIKNVVGGGFSEFLRDRCLGFFGN